MLNCYHSSLEDFYADQEDDYRVKISQKDSHKTINIQERKLKYLLNYANITLDDLHFRFNKIDEVMSKIKIGSKVYNGNCWGDVFEQIIINIIDKENGIVELYEESINKTTQDCILNYWLSFEEIK